MNPEICVDCGHVELTVNPQCSCGCHPETWPCNDCGLPCPKFDELCGPCYEEERRAKEWELLHPEARCPPRE
jgi:hypothetical protein